MFRFFFKIPSFTGESSNQSIFHIIYWYAQPNIFKQFPSTLTVFMYICMVGDYFWQKMDQPGKVEILLVVS